MWGSKFLKERRASLDRIKAVAIPLSLFFILAAVISLLAFNVFYTIKDGDRGVVLRGGKIVFVAQPGLNVKWPVLDTVRIISIRKNISRFERIHDYSSDIHEFNLDVSIIWHLAPNGIIEMYTKYNDLHSIEQVLVVSQVSEKIGLVISKYRGLQLMNDPDPFIEHAIATIKDAMGQLVIIDSVHFNKIMLTDMDRKVRPKVEAASAGPN